MCRQIAIKGHLLPLEVIGKGAIVSIASPAIGIFSTSKCSCGYLAMLGGCLVHTLHLPIYLTISCERFHDRYTISTMSHK